MQTLGNSIIYSKRTNNWGDIVFLRQQAQEDPYRNVADKIREELMITFKNKGIKVSGLKIELTQGNINISAKINEKRCSL